MSRSGFRYATLSANLPLVFARDDYSLENCSVGRALDLFGDRWAFLILRESFFGERRFDRFQRRLGIARNVLADRLAALVAAGILERSKYQDRPERFEYRLTEMGRDLYPVIVTLKQWGDRWLADPAGPSVELVHHGCGERTRAELVCAECGEPLLARDVEPVPGPSALSVVA